MPPKAVHCKKALYGSFIYVGRPTKWGNKFTHRQGTKADIVVASRQEAVKAYEDWIMAPEQEEFRKEVRKELVGRNLGCWCVPKLCHAEVLLKVANENSI